MIERAYIHVGGPPGCGKTTFVEAVLGGTDRAILAARCIRNDALRRARETAPKAHPELLRYRHAGASGAALFAFPKGDSGSEAFFMTDLMSDYSEGVIVEGDNPLGFVDLGVFVAPTPQAGEDLFIRRTRDLAAQDRAKVDAWEQLLREPDGVAKWLSQQLGSPVVEFVRKNPKLLENTRKTMLAGLAQTRMAPTHKPVAHWAIAERYAGIEHAGLVVVNVCHDSEWAAGERLVADVVRLRTDEDAFRDVLSSRGSRGRITAVVANLGDPNDPGRKKALARVRRALRARSS